MEQPPPATPHEIRQQIVEHGVQIRKLRASGTEEDAAKADEVLHALLALKNRYKELTGEEHRSKALCERHSLMDLAPCCNERLSGGNVL